MYEQQITKLNKTHK